EQARPRGNLAASLKFVEPAIEPEDVAAVTSRNEDVVRNSKAELLPQFEGEGLGALYKERLPIMAGVEAFADRSERRFGNILTRARDRPDIGPRNGDLHELCTRCRGRDIDATRKPGRRRIGGDRGTGIA